MDLCVSGKGVYAQMDYNTNTLGGGAAESGTVAPGSSIGYIYCMSNPSFLGLVKVGIVSGEGRTPLDRAAELSTTGVPTPFTVEFAKQVKNPRDKERQIHILLEKYHERVSPRREFFRATPDDVRGFFSLLDGENWAPFAERSEDTQEEEEESEEGDKKGGCRDMRKCFTDGQRIRHKGSCPNEWIGTYNSSTNKISFEEVDYTLGAFAKQHYKDERPDRTPECNAWKECECEMNGKWVSTHSLPAHS